MRFSDYEVVFDERILLVADVHLTNESFDHAFGTQSSTGIEVSNLRVFAEAGLNLIDITASLNIFELQSFRAAFEEEAFAQLALEAVV